MEKWGEEAEGLWDGLKVGGFLLAQGEGGLCARIFNKTSFFLKK